MEANCSDLMERSMQLQRLMAHYSGANRAVQTLADSKPGARRGARRAARRGTRRRMIADRPGGVAAGRFECTAAPVRSPGARSRCPQTGAAAAPRAARRPGLGAPWLGALPETPLPAPRAHAPPARAAGQPLMLPLTESLYVPAKLADAENVMVDVGTGYFVQVRSRTRGRARCAAGPLALASARGLRALRPAGRGRASGGARMHAEQPGGLRTAARARGAQRAPAPRAAAPRRCQQTARATFAGESRPSLRTRSKQSTRCAAK